MLKEKIMAMAAITLVLMLTSGCIAVQSFPNTARAGDTVMLAVGSPEGMTLANTSATFTPDGSTPVPLTIRSIFKLYPDKTSPVWTSSNARNVEIRTGHGPWTTIAAIDLPTGLPDGPGVVQFTTSAVYPPPPDRDINDALIGLEIVTGTGAPSQFKHEVAAGIVVTGDLSQLEPARRLVVKPTFTGTGSTTYGAIEVRLNIPFLDATNIDGTKIIADEKMDLYDTDRRVHYIWSRQGSDLVVSFMSPDGGLEYYHADFSIISSAIMTLIDLGFVNVGSLTPVVTYYDVDGNVVTGGDTFVVIDET